MVEHHLAKVGVADPNPVFRSGGRAGLGKRQALFLLPKGSSSGGMVDTKDLKSFIQKWMCGFDSRLEHRNPLRIAQGIFYGLDLDCRCRD